MSLAFSAPTMVSISSASTGPVITCISNLRCAADNPAVMHQHVMAVNHMLAQSVHINIMLTVVLWDVFLNISH